MKLVFHSMAHWPCLSWLAQCSPQENLIHVYHGSWVETRGEWFCEAVWAGDFEIGDFDKTDIVSGSGGRIRGNGLCFVSSGSNIDRLHSIHKGEATYVSNSLICLLTWIDADPEIGYSDYGADFANYRYTIFGKRTIAFPSTAGKIDLTYFSNLNWNGDHLEEQDKPCGARVFHDFDDYNKFLQQSMLLIAENAQNNARSRPYKLICPISNGYDSPTVAALLRNVDGVEAFTFDVDRHGEDDSGEAIATALGIPCHVIDRDAWHENELAEVPFLACSGSVGDLAFKSAEALMRGAVVMNGTYGDIVWGKHSAPPAPIAIGAGSMLGMTEYRLWAGFINCALALWGIRQLHEIINIGNNSNMQPWDVGGNYTRPICRRIVETAGVPRSLFGVDKRGVSVVTCARQKDLNRFSQGDLLAWINEQRKQAAYEKHSLPHPWLARILDGVITPLAPLVCWAARRVPRRRIKWMAPPIDYLKERLTHHYYHHRYRVHWAISRAKRRYRESE